MRYSLAGGYQANVENVAGSDYCPSRFAFYAPVSDIRLEIRETMDGWMDSPGHREAIMDPWAEKVNVGLEWSTYSFSAVQQFEGDYVEYVELPTIEGDVLTAAGRVKNGLSIATDERLVVAIFYDPPPRRLTKGQIARTWELRLPYSGSLHRRAAITLMMRQTKHSNSAPTLAMSHQTRHLQHRMMRRMSFGRRPAGLV